MINFFLIPLFSVRPKTWRKLFAQYESSIENIIQHYLVVSSKQISKITFANLVIALGIIYGDIGTSPLYVLNAIVSGKIIEEKLILGALSCIIWTLTLQTTVKYVWLTLKADNKGEGGIFSLYALVRRQRRWLVLPAMIGGAALLADGMITPPISVTSAIEGLRQMPVLHNIEPNNHRLYCVRNFGDTFFSAAIRHGFHRKTIRSHHVHLVCNDCCFGQPHLVDDLYIFKAFSPVYAIELLTIYPKGFWILGAVFLCTTGAEALYSDLGHCGRGNIRISWIYVKTCLILNYLGQGAWLLANYNGTSFRYSIKAASFSASCPLVCYSGNYYCNGCCHYRKPGIDKRIVYADQ